MVPDERGSVALMREGKADMTNKQTECWRIPDQRGLTVIELLVAMAIAAVMMMYAVPAFNDFTTQRQMAANVNYVISGINYARNEAARRGANVTLQAVDASDANNEWGPGFCVTQNPGDCNDPITRFEPEAGITIDGTLALHTLGAMTFNSRGMFTAGVIGAIEVCGADADDDPGRIVRISAVGRASVNDLVCFP